MEIYRASHSYGVRSPGRPFPGDGHPRIFPTLIRRDRPPLLELLLVLAATLSDDEDRALAEAIRSGDRSAFRRFFEAHHASLLRYLKHRHVEAAVAEDLVQNAFIYIWEQRQEIKVDGSLRGLLYRIAYTRALNHFRNTARFVDTEGPLPGADSLSARDPAEVADIGRRIDAAVAALPERRRAVFELCFLQDLSYREAAEALEISVKTVENQMGHALKAMRERLGSLR